MRFQYINFNLEILMKKLCLTLFFLIIIEPSIILANSIYTEEAPKPIGPFSQAIKNNLSNISETRGGFGYNLAK